MTSAAKKLKSKSGISLAISLVFFLLCAMVGTVTLSAASVNAGNTARERQLYRETLAMTSAANLLRQEVQALNFTGSYTKTETVTTTVPSDPESGTTTVETAKTFAEGECTLAGSSLFDESNLDLASLYFANQPDSSAPLAPSPAPVSLTMTFQPVAAQNIPEVTATLTVGTDYTLTIVLSCGNGGMTMTFAPKINTSTEIGPPAVTSPETDTSITKTVTTYSTALTWDAPVVTEGGAS